LGALAAKKGEATAWAHKASGCVNV